MADLPPIIRYTSIGEFTLDLVFIMKAFSVESRPKLKHVMVSEIMKAFAKAQIDMPPKIIRLEK